MSGRGTERRAVRIVASAAWVVGLSIVAKALGLLKDVVVAARFGTSSEMDAFLVAFAVPTLVIGWFQMPIRSGFIPLFTEGLERDGEEKTWRATGVFAGDLMALIGVITVVAVAAAPWIVSMVAPGFDPASRALAVSLTRIMLLSIVATTFGGLLTNLLHCHGNFALAGLGHPVNNLFLIGAAVFLTGVWGIQGLAWGVLLGSVGQALVQWPIIWQNRRLFRLGFDLRHPMFTGVLRLALPLFIGMAGAKLDDIVDRIFASQLAEGSISALGYALRLIELPREIVVLAFGTVLFPYYANLLAKGRDEEFGDRLVASMRMAFFVLVPVSVGFAMLGDPLVRVLLQRGQFDERSVSFTVSALVLYAPTILALGMTTIMISGFVALKDTRTPVIAGFARLGVKVALMFALVPALQHTGVALSTSLSHLLKFALFLFVLPAGVKKGRYAGMFRGYVGALVGGAAMAGAMQLVLLVAARSGAAGAGGLVAVLVAGAVVGLAVYWGASHFLAQRELIETVKAVKDGVNEILKKGRKPPIETVDIE